MVTSFPLSFGGAISPIYMAAKEIEVKAKPPKNLNASKLV